jgi:heme-transporting ATPase
MLRFENISKRFGTNVVLQHLRGRFGPGCVALCEENGGGKSTLLSILAGTVDADSGEVWIGDHSLRADPVKAKRALFYVPDDCLASPLQTGSALLALVADQEKTTIGDETWALAERFGLAPHLEKRFEQMSLGTRKKLFLTAATIGDPLVIIADEPSAGLDGASRKVLIELFTALSKARLVFFSSHDADLVERCAATQIGFADLGAMDAPQR